MNGFLPNRKVSTPYLKVETTTTTTDNLNNFSANKRQSAMNYAVKSTSGNVSRAMAQLLSHWLTSQGSFEARDESRLFYHRKCRRGYVTGMMGKFIIYTHKSTDNV